MIVEIDPEALVPPGSAGVRISASDALREAVSQIDAAHLRTVVRALGQTIAGAEDRPRAIELVGAINRLLEAAGVSLEPETADDLQHVAAQAVEGKRTVAS